MSADDIFVLWVIYDHPRDHPHHFVVRRQFVKRFERSTIPIEIAPLGTLASDDPRIELDNEKRLATSIGEARRLLPPGLSRFETQTDDDPCIVEVWI